MSEERDLANELVTANGISAEAQRETRKQQARRVITIEMRKSARYRFIAIAGWATTLVLIFASMWVAVLSIFLGVDPGVSPRAALMGLTMLGMLGMVAFVVAIISSIAWYFSARTASLATIDARLSELDVLLMTEMMKEDRPDPAA